MELVISGRDATVSGVTFTWLLRCWRCREVAHVAREDGKVLAGLRASASLKTCSWYQRDLPGRMPELPVACSECGEADRPFGYSAREAKAVASCACGYLAQLNEAYRVFRDGFPAEAAVADDAMIRALKR
jgi:hypothetical protein